MIPDNRYPIPDPRSPIPDPWSLHLDEQLERDGEQRRRAEDRRHGEKAGEITAGHILERSHQLGAEIAAHDADRIDEGEPGGGTDTGHEPGRNAPEDAARRRDADECD